MEHVVVAAIAANPGRVPEFEQFGAVAGIFSSEDESTRKSFTEGAVRKAVCAQATKPSGDSHNASKLKRTWNLVYNVLTNITLEPVLFLYAFGFIITQPVYSNMMMEKLCRQYCSYSEDQCRDYGSGKNTTMDNEVAKVWARFDNYLTIIGTAPAIVYALFMGPWSDVVGRRKPIIVTIIGSSTGYIISILLYFIPSLPLWMLFLPNFMTSLTGGLTSLMVSACSYAADISHDSNSRTIRFASYDVSLSCGVAIGGLLNGILIQEGVHYYVCYFVSLGSMCAALLLVLVRVRDTPQTIERMRNIPFWKALGSLFTLKHVAESFRTLIKPRSGRTRRCIWLIMFAFLLIFTTECGELQLVQKLFTNAPLRWTLSFYIFYTSIFEFGCMATAGVFIPIVKKIFRWRDSSFFITACVFRIIYCYGISMMRTDWSAYFFSVFDLLDYGVIIGPRCMISKLVADDEQGKMLSLYAISEALSPLLGSVAGTAIYTATVATWPGFFGIAEAYTMLVALSLVVLVDHYVRSDERFAQEKAAKGMKDGESQISNNDRTA